ncbi:unnamed protein product [Cuscuta epithymum]|uniref:Uncharacterized protein n=1 Tax=Cuscuta epithymum TaxID=186058 RepID=A0AAV0CFL7_9ASTE|nr:unnamed protein product [Cuscuta epithymum]
MRVAATMIQHIQNECGIKPITCRPTVIYEDNTTCIAQIKEGYIKGDRTKHISPKFFSTHDLEKDGTINIQQIRSSENPADLFTKSLPPKKFTELVQKIGMHRLQNLC